MHETMERLYAAARQLRNVEGQTRLADVLNESPQTVNNWESRGISASGALKAQRAIGCNACWVMDGEGPKAFTLPLTLEVRERVADLQSDDLLRLDNMLRAFLGLPVLNPDAPIHTPPRRRLAPAPANENVVPQRAGKRRV